ncbi:bifunctional methylenetetrahydrofolate dehydrogenase/methenyltetrahydrofolate cyclohydrolase FolD [Aurantiacibacter zhengii]|uniref:Bifunctional protein FolD n=1 Tax=Aurantiacibacter zhengii TaxID=2307003 RepID=A0A418NSJ9_9SPHN|nr:bifunctional methylenetetrahydrofolate dehydrogenase/methenyltetrahydrofolate cyclohydrolase FolD [Aurantiacibacter zhengii]RIV85922.1 bifunctional methylenetetrahydrofolate dehydrogenase/methenyltetrahydrofolate cyclohydrolase FolD [Aurantiacibacter zhengii]
MAEKIDGRAIARELDALTKAEIDAMVAAGRERPGLTVVLVGDDPASEVYVTHKVRACERVGLRSAEHRLPAATTQDELLALIGRLNADAHVHGILVQVPLPDHIDERAVIEAIDPAKDVDGFHPVNVGRLSTGTGGLRPCTPLGCIKLLQSVEPDLAGMDALVIGRSNIVGKPVAMMLTALGCTVTIAHSKTRDLPGKARAADIVVAAVGIANFVKGDWIKDGAIVIDVGINRTPGENGKDRLVGDVAFDEVQHARAVTPVPGGVGPMTIAVLLANTVQAAKALSA